MKQQNKHNDSGDFLENGKFEKMGNWPRIHQRSGKPQMRCVTRREILTKGKFHQKWRGGAKIHQRFGQIFK